MKTYNQTMRYAAMAYGRGKRVYAVLDIGKTRDEAQNVYNRMLAARKELAELQMGGEAAPEELKRLRDAIASDAQRYDDLMGAVRMAEGEQGARVAAQFNLRREQSARDARGGYFRALIGHERPGADILAALSLPITTGANPGNNLLPVTMSNELLTDIYADDAILAEVTMTQIEGLRLPRVSATDDEVDDVTPAGDEAHAIDIDSDLITWGRFPGRDKIYIPSAILRGTNTNLDGYLTGKLNETHRKRICRRLFRADATSSYAHMSLYDDTVVKIKQVTGETELDAIFAALADLPTEVRAVAKVVMTPAKWYALIKTLTNGAATLFGKPDEATLGFRVVMSDYATQTLVGDLKTIHVNYDDPLRVESDRDIDLDMTKVVINGDYDIQIEEPSRLRRVGVTAGTTGDEGAGGEGTEP